MLKSDNQKTEAQSVSANPSSRNVSRLGHAMKIRGDLNAREDVSIEGEFEGRIFLENNDLTVESGGRVKADIKVRNIVIRGKLEGNIQAAGKVLIETKGRMSGDITAARISVVEGAQFKGSVKITKAVTL